MHRISIRLKKIIQLAKGLCIDKEYPSVYCIKNRIYIAHESLQILIKFPLTPLEIPFEKPVRFRVNHLLGLAFKQIDDKKVRFIFGKDEKGIMKYWEPLPTCEDTAKNFKLLFLKKKNINKVILDKSLLMLLELKGQQFEVAQDIKVSANKGMFWADRDYIVKIDPKAKNPPSPRSCEFGIGKDLEKPLNKPLHPFGPYSVYMQSLFFPFCFADKISFYFNSNSIIYFKSNDKKIPFAGFMPYENKEIEL